MICSMTGFGRAEKHNSDRKITVEVKSVNHRYLDFSIRSPRMMNQFDSEIRTLMKRFAQRGKVGRVIIRHAKRGHAEGVPIPGGGAGGVQKIPGEEIFAGARTFYSSGGPNLESTWVKYSGSPVSSRISSPVRGWRNFSARAWRH